MKTIGFIGGGNMAEALIKGVLGADVFAAEQVVVSDVRGERLGELAEKYNVAITGDNCEVASRAEILVLSVKPQNISAVLEGIKADLREGGFVVSIAAGVRTAAIAEVLGDAAIVRVMPNTPALIGEGASALFAMVTIVRWSRLSRGCSLKSLKPFACFSREESR